jgi:hypothetical protein
MHGNSCIKHGSKETVELKYSKRCFYYGAITVKTVGPVKISVKRQQGKFVYGNNCRIKYETGMQHMQDFVWHTVTNRQPTQMEYNFHSSI